MSDDTAERPIWVDRRAALQRMRDNQIAAVARVYGIPTDVVAVLLDGSAAAQEGGTA